MVNYFRISLLFLLVTFTTQIFAQNADFETLSTENFKINYPSGWTVDQSGTMGTEFFIFDAPTNDDDLFSENINLMLEDKWSDTTTLESYGNYNLELLPKYIQDYKYISSELSQQNGTDVFKVEYTGASGTFKLHFKQVMAFKGDVIYIVTFTMEQNQVEVYESTAENILESFKIVE